MPKFQRYFESGIDKNSTGKQGHDHAKEKKGVLSEEVMSYYRQVSSTLEAGFDEDTPDVKTQFLTNVFSVLKDECVPVSRNQTVSRILEVLFDHSPPSQLRPVFCQFCKDLSIVAFDAFSSHVFQALLQYLPLMVVEKEEKDDATLKQVKESTVTLCTFMESHLRDVMTHVYGSHVLRTLLEVLGGVVVKQEIIRSRISRNQRINNLARGPEPNLAASKAFSEENKSWFETLSQKVVRLCNYEDHLSDTHYCPVLQTVLLILHKTSPSQYEELASTILEKTCTLTNSEDLPPDDVINRLPHVVQNEVGSYLVELLISLTAESKFEELYNWLFKGKLLYFAVHPYANYILQKLLACIPDKKLMQNVLDDISKYIEDILAVNHCGIVTKLAEACQRTGVGQDQFLTVLMSAFHCNEPESRHSKVTPLVASFQTYDVFFKSSEDQKEETKGLLKSVIIHGSLILQQLLRFSKPVLVVSSLLELSPAELLFLCCDKFGSHIVDAFFQSPTVRDKNKGAFVKKLIGLYINMACNRNGSRCLESIWKLISMQERILIAEDLCKNLERLEGNFTGRFVYRNFALYKFMNRRNEWKDIQGANSKKQQLLKGILEGKQNKKRKEQKTIPEPNAVGNEKKEIEIPHDNKKMEIEEDTAESPMTVLPENKKKKKGKTTPSEDASASVPESNADYSSDIWDSNKLKRKRKKKGKKRVTRSADDSEVNVDVEEKKRKHVEDVAHVEESGVSGKKRKRDVSDSDNSTEVIKSKKKKGKETKGEAESSDVSHKNEGKENKRTASNMTDGQEFISSKKGRKTAKKKAESVENVNQMQDAAVKSNDEQVHVSKKNKKKKDVVSDNAETDITAVKAKKKKGNVVAANEGDKPVSKKKKKKKPVQV